MSIENWDFSKNHTLYSPDKKDIRIYRYPDKWSVTGQEAARYIRKHVISEFKSEHPDVLDLLDKKMGGHFLMLIRSIMPYLMWVSNLYSSSGNEGKCAEAFILKYLPIEYHALAYNLYRIYRHGLAHTGFPRAFIDSDVLLAWHITGDRNRHLNVFDEVTIPLEIISPRVVTHCEGIEALTKWRS